MSELEQNSSPAVVLGVKLTEPVIVKCARKVPLPAEEITVPVPAPGGTGGIELAISLISVFPSYPASGATTSTEPGAKAVRSSGRRP